MFSGNRLRDLLRTTSSRQTLIFAFVFLLVTLVAIGVGRQLVEDLVLSHVTDLILKDVGTQSRSTRLERTDQVAKALELREYYDPRPERHSTVVDPDGKVVFGSAELFRMMSGAIPLCAPGLCVPASIAVENEDVYILGMRMPLADGGQYFSAYDIHPMLRRLRMIPSFVGVGVLTVLLVAVLISVRFGLINLRRVDAISDVLERYAGGQRDARVPQNGRCDEFARLGRELNQTLDRVNLLVEEVKSTSGHIAHELRTPMTRLQSRLIEIAESVQGHIRTEVLSAVEEVSHMHGLTRSIMRVGEIETGRCRHEFVDLDVGALLQDIADYYQPFAEARRCRIDVSVEETCRLTGDRDLLFQALANLVDNALKYAPEGMPIHLGAAQRGQWTEMMVSDHGPGIPAELWATAQQRFRRLENARGKPGEGLGLPLVKAIAELHRGSLDRLGGGPGFTVIIRIGD